MVSNIFSSQMFRCSKCILGQRTLRNPKNKKGYILNRFIIQVLIKQLHISSYKI